ncbi:hypothetical protein MANES_05G112450v8 [Manihot esculenta]|uniref:Uncharacterized protein n=1 Tax=Manihot esculenta TaxID=3983 RepID=A0ACB7HNA3_MANES|nr:hypothetical protein MANES_05G112450v8 [Manihot esculenta]
MRSKSYLPWLCFLHQSHLLPLCCLAPLLFTWKPPINRSEIKVGVVWTCQVIGNYTLQRDLIYGFAEVADPILACLWLWTPCLSRLSLF